jgi:hypothetical protein
LSAYGGAEPVSVAKRLLCRIGGDRPELADFGPAGAGIENRQRLPNKVKRTITIAAESDYEIHRLAEAWAST